MHASYFSHIAIDRCCFTQCHVILDVQLLFCVIIITVSRDFQVSCSGRHDENVLYIEFTWQENYLANIILVLLEHLESKRLYMKLSRKRTFSSLMVDYLMLVWILVCVH